jgi:hypothetical protein
MIIRFACPMLAPLIFWGGAAAAEEPLFPFVISYDAPQNITNVSAWLERPAGKHGFVHAQDGRLVSAAGPIRFWATNLCFEACFPSHEQAERVAARLARLGINCVRMHHMDSSAIWGDSPNKLTIDPKKIERLDCLIYQLKLHGIYTDLNLHVSRSLGKAEGFVAQQERPKYDKGLGNFEPRMIELQKKYARDLLTHVNPYTKTPYAEEPAVAFVEISNEDALFAIWSGNQLDNLPEPYATTFRKLWNAWLRKKYGSTEKLRRAWNVSQQPLGGELLRNGDFSQPLEGAWRLQTDRETKAELSVQPDGPEGRRCLRLVVARPGEVAWNPQLMQAGFAVKKDTAYTLTFFIRSDAKRQVGVNCMMAHEPWQRLGLSAKVDVGPDWQPYRRTFTAERDDPNARITWNELKPGSYELAAVSLRPGGITGLAADAGLEDQSVPVLLHNQLDATEAARNDFVDFLWDTERDYWWGMYRFLKDELKVRPLVSGTQLGYSPVHIQAGLDYLDAHAYWNHPRFPGRPWDPKNWTVRNVALVNSPGGTLASLAARRVAGMAYTVSEYNHPEPNQYAAEGFPMIAAFGALQSWDAIFSFSYSHNAEFEPRKITGFFNINSPTPRLAHMPACAAMFLRGDVASARQTVVAPLSLEAERQKLHETLNARKLTADNLGLDPQLSLLHGMALEIGKGKPPAASGVTGRLPARATHALPKDAAQFVSDTGQLRWDVAQQGAGFFVADTPRTKLFTGFVRGRTFELGDVRLKIGPTRLDWATVSMVCIDGEGFDKPGRVLIAATGLAQNQGAELKRLGGDDVTLGNQWGSEPVLCEGVPAEVVLPVASGRVRFYPLDESGGRRAAAPATAQADKTLLVLDPKYTTVWYEVQVR